VYNKEKLIVMAGHSKFKKIKHKKGAQDAKRSRSFTKLIREIIVAAKIGDSNPEFNPRLRTAIIAAREENMPKDKIDGAIKKATTNDPDSQYEEIRYEGYGPAGTAIIVEGLTDNRNRSNSEIRTIFGKNGGHLADIGSVSYMFNRIGYILYGKDAIESGDKLLNTVLESGADDCIEHDDHYEIICNKDSFHTAKEYLEKALGVPAEAKIGWMTDNMVHLTRDDAIKAMKLLDTLHDNDDVQSVSCNFTVDEDEE
jgi:YebC/PmpR family DNA-binding regulatory protein